VDIYTPAGVDRQKVEAELLNDPEVRVRAMAMGLMEKWRTQGLEEGRQEGQRQTLLQILGSRFGTLSAEVQARVQALTGKEMDKLTRVVATAKTLEEMGLVPPQS
jgi:hypothetical protein